MSVVAFRADRDAHAVDAVAHGLGLDLDGLERAGLERAGLERAGLERAGLERAGLEREGARAGWLRFAELVGQWGQRTDLVSADTAVALAEILFLDAAALAPLIPRDAHVLDVGAGVGAPTLPLALLRSDLRVELLEPRRRRVVFLRTAIGSLRLASRAKVVEGKLDDSGHAPVDVALSRATFAPDEWLERASAFATHVVLLLGRGETPTREGWRVEAERDYVVPSSNAARRAVVMTRA
jgi:16S rRNA (guanine527-N7)-methyltransferase